MKTAYELAMERLNRAAPSVKLTAAQKTSLAELDSKYAAKLAEREIFLQGERMKALEKQDYEALEQIDKQFVNERKALQAELEEKKETIRKAPSSEA